VKEESESVGLQLNIKKNIQPVISHDVSAYRLNKQLYSFLNLEPISCSIQDSNCCFSGDR